MSANGSGEFTTSGSIEIEVDQRSLSAARDEVESSIGSVSVGVDGGGAGVRTDGGRSIDRIGDRVESLVSLGQERNDILVGIRDALDDSEGGGGGSGGGGGGLGGLLGPLKRLLPFGVGGAPGGIATRLPGIGGLTTALANAARTAISSTIGSVGIGLGLGAGGIEILEETGITDAISNIGQSLQDSLAGDILGTLAGPAGTLGALTRGFDEIASGIIQLDPDQITAGLEESISSAETAFEGWVESSFGLSERLRTAGADILSAGNGTALNIEQAGGNLVQGLENAASNFPGVNLGGGGGNQNPAVTSSAGPAGGPTAAKNNPALIPSQPRAPGNQGTESTNVSVNAPISVEAGGRAPDRDRLRRQIKRVVEEEYDVAQGQSPVTETDRSDSFRRSNF